VAHLARPVITSYVLNEKRVPTAQKVRQKAAKW
jgi:hypothetical protein